MKESKVAAGMTVCGACAGLRGPCFDTFSHCERTQRCSCEPQEPRWKGYDYNTAIELCHACAAITVRSGSRWSWIYCETCKELALAYNRASGGAVIPLGRHSVMNGILLYEKDAAPPFAQAAFEAALAKLFARIDRLWSWHRARVREIVQSIPGEETAVPLERYLEHVRAHGPSPEVAFDALVVAVTAPTSGT